ncbi:MAG: NINE protein [Thainema sp.]
MNSSHTLSKPKNRSVAVALALAGVFFPGLHKFYLGQPGWGIVYLLLGFTPLMPIPRFASAVEGVWYLTQDSQTFSNKFNFAGSNQSQTVSQPTVNPEQISAIADALRQLDQLRQDGLISEYEFEQKRRCLLDKIE